MSGVLDTNLLGSYLVSRECAKRLIASGSRERGDGRVVLIGSITAQQIGEQLAEKGFEIDRRKISLSEPIKALGEHEVPVKLRREIVAPVKIVVNAAE